MLTWLRFATFLSKVRRSHKHLPDLLIVLFQPRTSVSAFFTQHSFPSFSILWSRNSIKNLDIEKKIALVVNAGNANACTGIVGQKEFFVFIDFIQKRLSIPSSNIFFCSTGIIGEIFPTKKLINTLHNSSWDWTASLEDAASSILTTDANKKVFFIKDCFVSIYSFCKGSGMISPNVATMLSFLFIDYPVEQKFLRWVTKMIVQNTLNKISVDADMSTNDSCFFFARPPLDGEDVISSIHHPLYYRLYCNLYRICSMHSVSIVSGGEGVTKCIFLLVKGGKDEKICQAVARSVVQSSLVRSSLYGSYYNHGYFMMAIGQVKHDLFQETIQMYVNNTLVYSNCTILNTELCNFYMKKKHICITIVIGASSCSSHMYFSDLSCQYVKDNALLSK